jgi:hypothetical protein
LWPFGRFFPFWYVVPWKKTLKLYFVGGPVGVPVVEVPEWEREGEVYEILTSLRTHKGGANGLVSTTNFFFLPISQMSLNPLQSDQISLWKNRPKCSQQPFSQWLHTYLFFVENRSQKIYKVLKNLPKVNNCPMGKNSPNGQKFAQ